MSPFWQQALADAIILGLAGIVVLLIYDCRNRDDSE